MADLSKIKLNGVTYNFKDAGARTAIGNLTSFNVEIISSFPASPDLHTIYFKQKTGTNNDIYDEYMYINNNWELIGSTAVDLSNYLQTTDIADWAKASTKPTYTASEVGAIATTHVVNNITSTDISNWNAKSDFSGSYNDLTDQPTIPAAQVQSDWNATSGMGAILNKPTIPDPVSVSNTLASGTLIATINGTNIYAPTYTNGDNLAYGGN